MDDGHLEVQFLQPIQNELDFSGDAALNIGLVAIGADFRPLVLISSIDLHPRRRSTICCHSTRFFTSVDFIMPSDIDEYGPLLICKMKDDPDIVGNTEAP